MGQEDGSSLRSSRVVAGYACRAGLESDPARAGWTPAVHDDAEMVQALLIWLVMYAGLFAAVGFVLYVSRGYSSWPRSNASLLRLASTIAFVLALVIWLALLLVE
jgi:hypothetical protein